MLIMMANFTFNPYEIIFFTNLPFSSMQNNLSNNRILPPELIPLKSMVLNLRVSLKCIIVTTQLVDGYSARDEFLGRSLEYKNILKHQKALVHLVLGQGKGPDNLYTSSHLISGNGTESTRKWITQDEHHI